MRRGRRGRLRNFCFGGSHPSTGKQKKSLGARASDAELALLLGGRWLHRSVGCLMIPPRACQGSPHRSLAPAHVKARAKKAARPSGPAKIEPPPRHTGATRCGLPPPSKSALHFYSPPQARSILASVLPRTLPYKRGRPASSARRAPKHTF